MKPYRSFAYLPPFAFEKLPSRENEQGLMANATEMPSFKMLCTNNNEFTGAAAHVAAPPPQQRQALCQVRQLASKWQRLATQLRAQRLWESVTVG